MKGKKPASFVALKIAVTYAVFGFLWILLSDKLLLFLVRDIDTVNQMQTYKGWFYVLATAALVFIMVEKYTRSLQLSQKRYRRLLGNISDQIYLVDATGTIVDTNNAAEEALGYTRGELIGQDLSRLDPELNLEEWTDMIRKTPVDHSFSLTTTHRRKNGTVFPVEVSACVFSEKDSRYCLGVARDITERLQTLDLLVQNEKMNSLGNMAAGIAHEINNPLSAIMGACQNLRNRIFNNTPANIKVAEKIPVDLEQVREYLIRRQVDRMLTSISSAGQRASTIVASMLNFSYKGPAQMKSCNLASLLDETLDLVSADFNLKNEYDFKKIKITRDYDKDDLPVCCIRSEIQQVFLNLFKNATEAMSEKEYSQGDGPHLTLRIRKSGRAMIIEVEDNGPGISTQSQKKIFEPFYTSKSVGKGTGLGLSISYFIITERHKGLMEVNSTPGEGTVFKISLPEEACDMCLYEGPESD